MAVSEFDTPGSNSANVGYTLRVAFPGGRSFMADRVTLSDFFTGDDLQSILDALAGIPGVLSVAVEEGRVANRTYSPNRPYEPAPPPPE